MIHLHGSAKAYPRRTSPERKSDSHPDRIIPPELVLRWNDLEATEQSVQEASVWPTRSLDPDRPLAEVSRDLVSELVGRAETRPNQLFFAHCNTDENLNGSSAAYLADGLFPVTAEVHSFSQLSACSALAALQYSLATGSESAVIVAADRWGPPCRRRFGDFAEYEDGAAAFLVGQRPSEVAIIGCRVQSRADLAISGDPMNRACLAEFRHAISLLVTQEMSQAAWADVDLVLAPSLGGDFVRECHASMGLSSASVIQSHSDGTFLSSADPIMALDSFARAKPRKSIERALLWTAGPGGDFGCVLLVRRSET